MSFIIISYGEIEIASHFTWNKHRAFSLWYIDESFIIVEIHCPSIRVTTVEMKREMKNKRIKSSLLYIYSLDLVNTNSSGTTASRQENESPMNLVVLFLNLLNDLMILMSCLFYLISLRYEVLRLWLRLGTSFSILTDG